MKFPATGSKVTSLNRQTNTHIYSQWQQTDPTEIITYPHRRMVMKLVSITKLSHSCFRSNVKIQFEGLKEDWALFLLCAWIDLGPARRRMFFETSTGKQLNTVPDQWQGVISICTHPTRNTTRYLILTVIFEWILNICTSIILFGRLSFHCE